MTRNVFVRFYTRRNANRRRELIAGAHECRLERLRYVKLASRRIDKDFREFFDRLRVLRRERDGGMEPLLMAMATGYDYRKYQKVKANERRHA